MDITPDDLDNVRHMLGLTDPYSKGKAYRNHYVAGPADVPSMERLRAAGLVVLNERIHPELTGGDPCYHATLLGARMVGLSKLPD